MQDKIIFREMLSEIKKLADEKGNRLTQEEIREFFKNVPLEESHFSLIFEYLAGEKIRIEGYQPRKDISQGDGISEKPEEGRKQEAEEEAADDLERAPLDFYLEELQGIAQITGEEKWKLFQLAAAGDPAAKSRLTQSYLQTVYDLSRTYSFEGVPQGDLIQEGNVGLILALEELEVGLDLEAYEAFLFEKIQKAMEEALEESQDIRDMGEKIAERANHLQEAVDNLERDLEHKVSIEELSAYLEMPVEEIKDILRMAGDEIKVEAIHKADREEE
ncbi:MAG: sigma-70 domain-containing protein [Candidatus Limivivens sp.]|nr:sigma-70 domain-containing protein [Candidatus Limivivens sp.]